ncbi:hypothetical protein ACVOMT_05965 [Sphingomonas panni]
MLYAAYLLPLLIGRVIGLPAGQLPKPVETGKWVFCRYRVGTSRERVEASAHDTAETFVKAVGLTDREVHAQASNDDYDFGLEAVNNTRLWGYDSQPISAVDSYPKLVAAVSRFKSVTA